jgi:hypothetical protein
MRARNLVELGCLSSVLLLSTPLLAREQTERQPTPEEISAWLDARGLPKSDADKGTDADLVPQRPPRKHGFVLESSIGVLGHLGPMKHISPTAPWFHLQFGFEPLRWLMLFAEADLVFGNTSYAHPPPAPRTYALYGAGAGLRFTITPADVLGLYLQGSVGGAEVSEDVLATYGYRNADSLNLYAAAELGVEWYQVSPHLGLGFHGGVRSYGPGFERQGTGGAALAWVSGIGLRYVF